MNAIAAAHPSRVAPGRILWLETRNELLKALRMPAYLLPTLLFPSMFYLLFGISLGGKNANQATYLLASYSTFGLIGATLFGLGVGLAIERGQGWMLLKRATPMPAAQHFAARVGVACLMGLVVVLLLCAIGAATRVDLPAATWLRLIAVCCLNTIPFAAIGLACGHWLGPNSAPAIINLTYIPISFLSGLWLPIQMLPQPLQKLAIFMPPYHANQLALRTLGMAREEQIWVSVAVLALTTTIALFCARLGQRRDEGLTYG
jgi:ABC-2 type transport system permease protein